MATFLAKRTGQAILVLLGVTLAVFILEQLMPGSIARAILGPRATRQALTAFNAANGLDHPLPIQYLDFLHRLLEGNLGFSYKLNQSVDFAGPAPGTQRPDPRRPRAAVLAVDRDPARALPGRQARSRR